MQVDFEHRQGFIYTPITGGGGVEPPMFSGHPTKIRPPIGGVQAFASTRPRHNHSLQVQPCYSRNLLDLH